MGRWEMKKSQRVVAFMAIIVCATLCYWAGQGVSGSTAEFELGEVILTEDREPADHDVSARRVRPDEGEGDTPVDQKRATSCVVRGRVMMAGGVRPAKGAVVHLQGHGVGLQGETKEVLESHGAELGAESEEVRTVLIMQKTTVASDGRFAWQSVRPGKYGVHVELRTPGLTSLAMVSIAIGTEDSDSEPLVYELGDILLGSMAIQDADGAQLLLPTESVAGAVVVSDETERGVSVDLLERTALACRVLVLSPTGMRARIGCQPDALGRWRIEGLSPRRDGVFQLWSEMGDADGGRGRVAALRAYHVARSERLAAVSDPKERDRILRERPSLAVSTVSPFHPFQGRWGTASHFVAPGDVQPDPLRIDLRFVIEDPAVYYGTVEVDVRSQGGFEDDSPHGMLVTTKQGRPLPVPLSLLTDGRATFSLTCLGPVGQGPAPYWLEVYGTSRNVRMQLRALSHEVAEDGETGLLVCAMQCLPEISGGTFQWQRGKNVRGRLVDESGEPQGGIFLGLSRVGTTDHIEREESPPLSRTAVTNEEGQFCFFQVHQWGEFGISAPMGLPPGLHLKDRRGEPCEWTEIDVPAGEGEVQLPGSLSLAGVRRLEKH